MKKNKYILLGLFTILLFSSTSSALALDPGLGLGPNATLPQYISYLFGWAMAIAGTLALISFVIGAVGLIASGDSAEGASSAKDRMKGAVLGLLLTLSSFIILKTINPALVSPVLNTPPMVVITPLAAQPGVYFYVSTNCTGENSGALTSSDNNLKNAVSGKKIGSVKVINNTDPTNPVYYGTIVHQAPDLKNGGICSTPIVGTNSCKDISALNASSADIFIANTNQGSSGDGIIFYSEPYGWNIGANAGFYNLKDDIKFYSLSNKTSPANSLIFLYTNVNRPNEYKNNCPNFTSCPGSIKIKGNYLVALYSPTSSYCQTFTKDVENLNGQPFIGSGTTTTGMTYYVIATK